MASDQGYNRQTDAWATTGSHGRDDEDIPVPIVNSNRLHPHGSIPRPCDSNSGSAQNVSLRTHGLASGHPLPHNPEPLFHQDRRGVGCREIHDSWLFGYNHSLAKFDHQGDWEHMTVHVSSGRIVDVCLAAHNRSERRAVPWMSFVGWRPVVRVARGSHAAYATTGPPGPCRKHVDP